MLSKRITAKSLDAKPTIQASVNTIKVSRLFDPDALIREALEPAAGLTLDAMIGYTYTTDVDKSWPTAIGHVWSRRRLAPPAGTERYHDDRMPKYLQIYKIYI